MFTLWFDNSQADYVMHLWNIAIEMVSWKEIMKWAFLYLKVADISLKLDLTQTAFLCRGRMTFFVAIVQYEILCDQKTSPLRFILYSFHYY